MTLSEDEDESLAHFLESEVLSEVSDQEDEKPSKRLRVDQNGVVSKYPRRIDDGFFSLIPPELFPHILKFLSSECVMILARRWFLIQTMSSWCVQFLGIVLIDCFPHLKSEETCVTNNGTFINNEFDDVYLVTTVAPIPLEAFTLQESEVSAVKYFSIEEYKQALIKKDPQYVPNNINGQYGQLFDTIVKRYQSNVEARTLDIQKKINRYARISLSAEVLFSFYLQSFCEL
ncbi:hypothetical protein M8C21_010792 [Ambrosia artemisiifolia]|uniref:F-box protein n=1 Tax=Ambrosia artemisiifolia TaxID=4212 RepID=A0AAD5G8J0_AMBAR|nr:hypothetical protein M8C21_010792 [Ambrosia artemisiifolia]